MDNLEQQMRSTEVMEQLRKQNMQQEQEQFMNLRNEQLERQAQGEQVQAEQGMIQKEPEMSEVQIFMAEKMGEKFDEKAPLSKAQEAELQNTNFIKRGSKRRAMERERKNQYQNRAMVMWNMNKDEQANIAMNQGEEQEHENSIERRIPENPYSMEKMPRIQDLRKTVTSLEGLNPDDALRSVQLVNNSSMWLGMAMKPSNAEDLTNEMYESLGKARTEMLDSVIKQLSELNLLTKGVEKNEINKENLAVVSSETQSIINELSGVREVFSQRISNVGSARKESMSDLLRRAGLGKALRTEQQQEEFRIIEKERFELRQKITANETEKVIKGRNMNDVASELNYHKFFSKRGDEIEKAAYEAGYYLERHHGGENNGLRKNNGHLPIINMDSEYQPLLGQEQKVKETQDRFNRFNYGTPQEREAEFGRYVDEVIAANKTIEGKQVDSAYVLRDTDSAGHVSRMQLEMENTVSDNIEIFKRLPADKIYQFEVGRNVAGNYGTIFTAYNNISRTAISEAMEESRITGIEKEFKDLLNFDGMQKQIDNLHDISEGRKDIFGNSNPESIKRTKAAVVASFLVKGEYSNSKDKMVEDMRIKGQKQTPEQRNMMESLAVSRKTVYGNEADDKERVDEINDVKEIVPLISAEKPTEKMIEDGSKALSRRLEVRKLTKDMYSPEYIVQNLGEMTEVASLVEVMNGIEKLYPGCLNEDKNYMEFKNFHEYFLKVIEGQQLELRSGKYKFKYVQDSDKAAQARLDAEQMRNDMYN